MSIILIIAIIWGASALVRTSKEAKRQRELEKQRREAAARSAEFARMVAESKAETARLVALEREQMRQAREQEKLAKEQEKQAAQLAKHEKQIAALECKARKLDRDIKATNERIGEYYGRLDWYLLQQSGTVSSGKEFRKWQDKIENVTDQIRKAENKIADMKDAKAMAQREMEAA